MNDPESKGNGVGPRIERAGKSDLADLAAVASANGAFKAGDYFTTCLKAQGEGKRILYIVRAGREAAGYGMLNFHPRYALYRRLGIPEIQDLNVIPAFRRRGIAAAMIEKFEGQARAHGHDQIGISVGLHADFGAAQRLYIKAGYIPDGFGVTYDREPVRPGEIRPVDDDLCLMLVKSLT